MNNKALRLALTLFIIAGAVTGLLAVANALTRDRIVELNEKKETEARKEVVTTAKEFKQAELPSGTDEIVTAVYEGIDGQSTVGYAVNVSPSGFGGAISMMVGFDAQGKVTGVKIINYAETPGLGTKTNDDEFKNQYKGKSAPISVIKSGEPKENEITAVSGATISSTAVTTGVNKAAEAVDKLAGRKGA